MVGIALDVSDEAEAILLSEVNGPSQKIPDMRANIAVFSGGWEMRYARLSSLAWFIQDPSSSTLGELQSITECGVQPRSRGQRIVRQDSGTHACLIGQS